MLVLDTVPIKKDVNIKLTKNETSIFTNTSLLNKYRKTKPANTAAFHLLPLPCVSHVVAEANKRQLYSQAK